MTNLDYFLGMLGRGGTPFSVASDVGYHKCVLVAGARFYFNVEGRFELARFEDERAVEETGAPSRARL